MSDQDEDKQYEASQKKLDDARKKGELPRSTDLTTAASYGGFLLASLSMGAIALQNMGQLMANMVGQSDRLAPTLFGDSSAPIYGGFILEIALEIGPWFLIPAVLAILSIIAQRSFVVAPQKLAPKLSRISPISNAKNKFGRSGLFEFSKSFFKLLIYSAILTVFLSLNISKILSTIHLTPAMATAVLLELVIEFFFIVLVIAAVIGGVDFLFQYQEHLRKNRMSRKELMDEMKQSEGDPHFKQKRRQRGQEIALSQMLGVVPDADVIVVNPTHYAVALKWDRDSGMAPVCVAKGVDEVAARIREVASENGVPIHRDPPTARAIFAVVEIGDEIEPDHYQAVAAAIRFAEKMRSKMRGIGGIDIG